MLIRACIIGSFPFSEKFSGRWVRKKLGVISIDLKFDRTDVLTIWDNSSARIFNIIVNMVDLCSTKPDGQVAYFYVGFDRHPRMVIPFFEEKNEESREIQIKPSQFEKDTFVAPPLKVEDSDSFIDQLVDILCQNYMELKSKNENRLQNRVKIAQEKEETLQREQQEQKLKNTRVEVTMFVRGRPETIKITACTRIKEIEEMTHGHLEILVHGQTMTFKEDDKFLTIYTNLCPKDGSVVIPAMLIS